MTSSSLTQTCPVCSAMLTSNECRLCSYREVKVTEREKKLERIDVIIDRFYELDDEHKIKFLVKMMGSIESVADCVFNHTMSIDDMKERDDEELEWILDYLEEGHRVIDDMIEGQILGQV